MTAHTYTFPRVLRVLDRRDGTKYPFEGLGDFACLSSVGYRTVVPGRAATLPSGLALPGGAEGFLTDFASVPTKPLKRWLAPQELVPCFGENIQGPWVVYVYHLDADGELVLAGFIRSAVAFAAYIHDWLYSIESIPRAVCDRIFYEILVQGGMWSAYLMYSAVRVGGGLCWPHPLDEVREDRELGRQAMLRWIDTYTQTEMPL